MAAAVADGAEASFAEVTRWVRTTLEDAGVDMTGAKLRDNSGLSSGQVVPARVISDVMQLGITGSATSMTRVLSDLPIAGLTGTLHDRFLVEESRGAAGIARAWKPLVLGEVDPPSSVLRHAYLIGASAVRAGE